MVGNRTGNRNPALISQGSDNQPGGRSEVFIAIIHGGGDLPDHTDVILLDVVLELLLPGEIVDGLDLNVDEVGDDVSIVHISCDQGNCYLVVQGFQIGSYKFSELIQLL